MVNGEKQLTSRPLTLAISPRTRERTPQRGAAGFFLGTYLLSFRGR